MTRVFVSREQSHGPGLGLVFGRARREKGRMMLTATLGMLTMLPVVFGVAGYAMVSR
jgi:hypothetical protein